MMNFYDLLPFQRTGLLALFFVAWCINVCLLGTVFKRRYRLPKILVPLGGLANMTVLILCAATVRAGRQHLEPSLAADWFCRQPVLIPVLIVSVIVAYNSYVIYEGWRYRKTTLTRSSIKEGVDKVSSGLCFYYDGGRVILLNNRMNELCHAIVGRDLQNAELFREILRGGQVRPDVTRLTEGDGPSFRLPDGSVWLFAYADLGGIHQLSATDVTQLQAVTDELKEKNAQLAALNLRLRRYGEHVDELTRSKERLEIKARIHRELGQALLVSRRYLLEEEWERPAPLEQWQRNIAVLRKEAEQQETEKPMDMLTRVARMTGIEIEIDGQLPEDEEVQKLFVQAAAETLTNAISHAKAKTLFVSLRQNENSYAVQFRNDGIQPKGKIVEGGGLGSLRRKIEREGGEMTVEESPEFALTVTLPKESGDIL